MKVTVDGKEIEVFTSEEVDAKAKEAAQAAVKQAEDKFKSENENAVKEKEELANKLKEAEDLLKAAEDKGGNEGQIKRLREERDAARKAAEEAAKNVDQKLDAFKKEIMGGTKDQLLDAYAKGDVELRKKIEYHFDNYRPSDTTPAALKERMEMAVTMATGTKPTPNPLDGRTGGGDRGTGNSGGGAGQSKELNSNQKAIGAVLGITGKDRENHANFVKQREALKDAGVIPPGSNIL